MKDKDILNMLGLNDRTITLSGNDEYLQLVLEKKIDTYLKKLDGEREKKEMVNMLKKGYEDFKKKDDFVKTFESNYVYNKIRNKLIQDGFVYQCKFCWGLDVSGQYGKRQKPKH